MVIEQLHNWKIVFKLRIFLSNEYIYMLALFIGLVEFKILLFFKFSTLILSLNAKELYLS